MKVEPYHWWVEFYARDHESPWDDRLYWQHVNWLGEDIRSQMVTFSRAMEAAAQLKGRQGVHRLYNIATKQVIMLT